MSDIEHPTADVVEQIDGNDADMPDPDVGNAGPRGLNT
jgi:hypothetical protein